MPFSRPTLTTLVAQSRGDLDGRLPGADSRLRRSAVSVLATVWAGGLHGLYGLLDWTWRQILPDLAEAETMRRWAAFFGLTPIAATRARGAVVVTGTDGAIVPAGARLLRSDGMAYAVDAAATVAGAGAGFVVTAAEAGAAANCATGTRLTFASPIAGVSAVATVWTGGLGQGADDETDAAFLGRLLDRVRQPPAGGKAADYPRWAKEVAGVTRAWVYPLWLGPGTVGVTFVMDGRSDIVPLPADVAAVAAHIEAERPVTAAVTVFAPVPAPIGFQIRVAPSTPEVRAAVTAALADLVAREAVPGGTLLVSHIREAISGAAGEIDHELLAPVANVVSLPGRLAVPGVIAWVA